MNITPKKEPILLFFGDMMIFVICLWLTLFIRYGDIPESQILSIHLAPFALLFLVWSVVYFIAGLYEKHTIILKSNLPTVILKTQVVNSLIATIFFYFIPYFGIAPKTNLFIYLFISFVFILGWRLYIFESLGVRKKDSAILIGQGEEMRELRDEVNNNTRYGMQFISSIDLNSMESLDFREEILKRIYGEDVSIIAIDLRNEKVEPMLPNLYNLIFSKIRFIDMHKVYEDIFDRIPLSLVKYSWFLENISASSNVVYDFLKRVMDIILAFLLGVISLVVYPFVFIAIKLDDKGPFFIVQDRVGQNNRLLKIYKFRTMMVDDAGKSEEVRQNTVTRVGEFLRKTRIDELPQLWNVLKGDMSMIGPRPELPVHVKTYEKEIAYYNVRHLIKPGLSGWAQLYHKTPPKVMADEKQTKIKLSYDLYYIKNRSFMLDLKIALRTIKTLLSRSGI